jgi:hypothetical protein
MEKDKIDMNNNLDQTPNTFVIKDYLQKYLDTSSKPFLKEIILLATIYFFYINVEIDVLTLALKYALILFVLRYLLSVFTDIQNVNSKRRYFQINGNVLLFSVILLIIAKKNYIGYNWVWVLIISYSLLVISTLEHYTSDIIITVLLVHYVLTNNFITSYV